MFLKEEGGRVTKQELAETLKQELSYRNHHAWHTGCL
jgi:hypothetical protein